MKRLQRLDDHRRATTEHLREVEERLVDAVAREYELIDERKRAQEHGAFASQVVDNIQHSSDKVDNVHRETAENFHEVKARLEKLRERATANADEMVMFIKSHPPTDGTPIGDLNLDLMAMPTTPWPCRRPSRMPWPKGTSWSRLPWPGCTRCTPASKGYNFDSTKENFTLNLSLSIVSSELHTRADELVQTGELSREDAVYVKGAVRAAVSERRGAREGWTKPLHLSKVQPKAIRKLKRAEEKLLRLVFKAEVRRVM